MKAVRKRRGSVKLPLVPALQVGFPPRGADDVTIIAPRLAFDEDMRAVSGVQRMVSVSHFPGVYPLNIKGERLQQCSHFTYYGMFVSWA